MVDEIEVDGILSTNDNMLAVKGKYNETQDPETGEWVYQWSGDYIYPLIREILSNLHAEMRPAADGTPPKEIGTTPANPYFWFFGSQGVPRNNA